MISKVGKDDWKELIGILKEVEKGILSSQSRETGSDWESLPSRQALHSFQEKALELGILDLQQVGQHLERYAREQIEPSSNNEALGVFSFAVNALLDQMESIRNGANGSDLQVSEVMEILGMMVSGDVAGTLSVEDFPTDSILACETGPGQEDRDDAPKVHHLDRQTLEPVDIQRLELTVRQLGGEVFFSQEEGAKNLVLRFQATPEAIEQIETLLSVGAPETLFAPQIPRSGSRFDKILTTIREFMMALSNGDYWQAQEILLTLAEQQHQAGLYNEIGGLARELHNSLKHFMETMDPHLKELVEEKIPDTGNRLEHILELTENAANTTIDHVEAMQRRNDQEQERLTDLDNIFGKLKAIGDPAHDRVIQGQEILKDFRSSLEKTRDDLIVVLTAQDYQDLTGQIVLKIIQLLKDLELKLVNVIRTFGMKSEEAKAFKEEELYGPAHKARTEALHSQDDVDSLLAEFGF